MLIDKNVHNIVAKIHQRQLSVDIIPSDLRQEEDIVNWRGLVRLSGQREGTNL